MLIIIGIILILVIYILYTRSSLKKEQKGVDLENSFVVDVREKGEFASEHSDKSINIPLSEIQVGKIDCFKNTNKENIVLVCRSGNRAGMAGVILKQKLVTKRIINLGAWQNLNKQ